MYEYTYVRLNEPRVLSLFKRMDIYFDSCHSVIERYAREGWRFVTVLKPFGDNTVSELVFERPVG